MNIKEFRSDGYLQEVNRRFFHPLGLALEVVVNSETGEEVLGGIWDYRDDPEGIAYGPDVSLRREAAERVDAEVAKRADVRREKFGGTIQPI